MRLNWSELSVHSDRVVAREEAVRLAAAALTTERRKAFFNESERRFRDPDTYAVLSYCVGFGLHHVYLGHWRAFLLDLVTAVVFWWALLSWLWSRDGSLWLAGAAFLYTTADFIYCLTFGEWIVRRENVTRQEQWLAAHPASQQGGPRASL